MIKETLSNEESGVEAKEDVASVGENKKPLSLKEKLSQLNESIASEVKENGEKFKNKIETLKDEIEKVKSERTVLAGEGRSVVKEASVLTEEQKASVGFEEGFKDEIRGPLAVLRAKQQELEKQLVDADREYSYTMEKKNLLAYSQNSGVEGKSILNRISQLEEQKTNDIAKEELNQKISPEINKIFVYPKNILDLENEATYITSETRKLTEQFSEKDVLQKVKNKYFEKLDENLSSLDTDEQTKSKIRDVFARRLNLKIDKEWTEQNPDFNEIKKVGEDVEDIKSILGDNGINSDKEVQSRVVAWTKMDSWRGLTGIISSVDADGMPHIREMDDVEKNVYSYVEQCTKEVATIKESQANLKKPGFFATKFDKEQYERNITKLAQDLERAEKKEVDAKDTAETIKKDMEILAKSKTFELLKKVGLTEKFKGKEVKGFELGKEAREIAESIDQKPELVLDSEQSREQYKKYMEYQELAEGEKSMDKYLKKYKQIIKETQK